MASSSSYDDDKEKGHVAVVAPDASDTTARGLEEERRYGRIGPFLAKVFNSGVESRGVERVPEDQREDKHAWNKCVCNRSLFRV